MASPGSEDRGRGARVGGLELSPQRDAEPPLLRLGVSNTGVNGTLLHPERLSPFTSLHLSFPSLSFSSLPSPLQVGLLIAARESGEALKLLQWVRAKPGRQTPSAAFSAYGMQFLANIFMQIVLAPTSLLSRKTFLNEFAIISGPGLETVGGVNCPHLPPPRGNANEPLQKKAHLSQAPV